MSLKQMHNCICKFHVEFDQGVWKLGIVYRLVSNSQPKDTYEEYETSIFKVYT